MFTFSDVSEKFAKVMYFSFFLERLSQIVYTSGPTKSGHTIAFKERMKGM